eukprot:354050-Rhodomonas_salina.1
MGHCTEWGIARNGALKQRRGGGGQRNGVLLRSGQWKGVGRSQRDEALQRNGAVLPRNGALKQRTWGVQRSECLRRNGALKGMGHCAGTDRRKELDEERPLFCSRLECLEVDV